jgi:hypothetical protein
LFHAQGDASTGDDRGRSKSADAKRSATVCDATIHRSFTTPTLFLCPSFSFMCGANPHHLQKQKKHPLSEWARTAGRTAGRTGTSLEISWQAARRRGTRSDTLAHLHLPIDTHTSPRSSDSLHRIVYQEPREGKGGSSSNSTQSPMQHTQTAQVRGASTHVQTHSLFSLFSLFSLPIPILPHCHTHPSLHIPHPPPNADT